MKPSRAASRRYLPGSPFNTEVAAPPVEQFAVDDRVTHERYGLGKVVALEGDVAVLVDFGARRVRIVSPYDTLVRL
jgi:hypothetical protein